MAVFRILLAFFIASSFASTAKGEDDYPRVTLSGFGNITATRHNDSRYVYVGDASQYSLDVAGKTLKRDSRLGVQLNADFADNFGIAVQFLARERVGFSPADSIEFAYARYNPQPDTEIRLGRIPVDNFLVADHRWVSYAQPWLRAPMEFYGPFSHFDGADLAQKFRFDSGTFTAKIYAGRSDVRVPFPPTSDYISLAPVHGFKLQWETDDWKIYAAHTAGRYSNKSLMPSWFQQQLETLEAFGYSDARWFINNLTTQGHRTSSGSIGGLYDDGTWRLQSEYAILTQTIEGIARGRRFYAFGGRRFGQFLPYLIYARSTDSRNIQPTDPGGFFSNSWSQISTFAINDNRAIQTTRSAGVRWDITDSTAIKAQYDWTKLPGDAWGFMPIRAGAPREPSTEKIFSLSLDFKF